MSLVEIKPFLRVPGYSIVFGVNVLHEDHDMKVPLRIIEHLAGLKALDAPEAMFSDFDGLGCQVKDAGIE
ncbi:hypothetical protein PG999_001315 [Apiospora kogelbergensis]|uniref:Uncharacterized protein n=1 Tax=Apiospora kogelbergensis TaxID=1337665 RepID=A0AAW0RDY3_9PEZI